LIFFVPRRRREPEIEILDRGFFGCRTCGVERSYQRWLFENPQLTHIKPIGLVRRVEFVHCDACKSTFNLEALDSQSAKSAGELLIHLSSTQLRARRH